MGMAPRSLQHSTSELQLKNKMLPWCVCLTQTLEMNVACQERSKTGLRFIVAYVEPHQCVFKVKSVLSPRYPRNPPGEGG